VRGDPAGGGAAGDAGVPGAVRVPRGALPVRAGQRGPAAAAGERPDAPAGPGQTGLVLRRDLRSDLCKLSVIIINTFYMY